MDRDKIIALVLVIGLVFLFVALIGVLTVTGFVLFFVTNEPVNAVDTTPLIDTNPDTALNTGTTGNTNTNTNTQTNDNSNTDPDPEPEPTPEPEPEPEPEPTPEPEAELLDDIEVQSLTYWCAKDFDGEEGLAIKIIKFKNTGTEDFSYTDRITLKSATDSANDSISTNSAYNFEVKGGKTTDIYQKDLLRSSAPYLFVGNSLGNITLTFEFGDDYYFEHEFTLKGQDFADANCQ